MEYTEIEKLIENKKFKNNCVFVVVNYYLQINI